MPEILENVRILLRVDTAANWTLANPVLMRGELGIELGVAGVTSTKMKAGDGTTRWNLLEYSNVTPEQLAELAESLQETITESTIILTKAQLLTYEDPPSSGLYPLLAHKNVIISDADGPSGGGGVAGDAVNVAYDNPLYPTVQAALDKLLHVSLSASLSVVGGAIHEIGEVVTDVTLAWTVNKDVTTQTLNNGIGALAATLRAYTHSGQSISSSRTYTLTVSDGSETKNASVTLEFQPKRFWGVSANPTLTDTEILAMSQEFATGRAQTRTFDCSGGKYFYVILPADFGAATFLVNGFTYSAYELVTRNVSNEYSHTQMYNIYRSSLVMNGSAITVVVN